MRKVSGIVLVCSVLLLTGAGCVFNGSTTKNATNYTATTTVKKDFYVNKGAADNLDVPFSEWQKFYQKKYGWEFSYPEGWQIRTEKTENQLLIFLSNVACTNQCPPEYVGLKMKVGAIYPGGDFIKYIKNDISDNNKGKIYPGGKVENVKISGRAAVKVSRSDWTGAEPGAGYFVALDKDYYAYVSVGRNNLTKNAETVISQLVGSIKIYNNYILRPSVLEKMAKAGNGDIDTDENSETEDDGNSSVYTSKRYKFTFNYPEHCYFSNLTDQAQVIINLDLALCGTKTSEPIVGVKVYSGGIDSAWEYINLDRNLSYQMQNILISDQHGRMYTTVSGQSQNERWLLVERKNLTYIIYVLNDTGNYSDDFDRIVSGFKLN